MTTYQQCDGQYHKTSGDHPDGLLIWWRSKKTCFNRLRNICRQRRSLLRTSQNENVCESVIANTEKRYWCLTYGVSLNEGFCCNLINQIPQVSCWIAKRHNDQEHQNKNSLQGRHTGGEKKQCQFWQNKEARSNKRGRSELTISSNITSAGSDMKKSEASGGI